MFCVFLSGHNIKENVLYTLTTSRWWCFAYTKQWHKLTDKAERLSYCEVWLAPIVGDLVVLLSNLTRFPLQKS